MIEYGLHEELLCDKGNHLLWLTQVYFVRLNSSELYINYT